MVWVPDHISEARIGEVLCGSGTPITRDMWLGNKLVDELAKLGAQAIKAPQDVVRRVVARQRQAQELAVFVGPGIDGKPQRDSTGMPKVREGARRGDDVPALKLARTKVVTMLLRPALWSCRRRTSPLGPDLHPLLRLRQLVPAASRCESRSPERSFF